LATTIYINCSCRGGGPITNIELFFIKDVELFKNNQEIKMNKKSKIFAGVTTLMLLLVLSVTVVSAGPAPKVDVCHRTDAGVYILINISENAFQSHVDHGDGGPGDMVPGMPGKMFGPDCSVVNANANVAGTWSGRSGTVGNLAYPFNMYLGQDSAGNVTGTVNYTNGVVRTVTGVVSGNNFTFTTHDNPSDPTQAYWADCTPCTVTTGGTYFHGYGTSSSNQSIEWEATKQ
jgi:hypothetical protein